VDGRVSGRAEGDVSGRAGSRVTDGTRGGSGRGSRVWRRYGAGPGHLAAMAGCFLLAGYAASRLLGDPALFRIAIWFVGAAVVWDLVLGPLLALVDRGLRAGTARVRAGGVSALNYLRVPALLSGLLLLLFAPSVLGRSEGVFTAKSGLSQDVYLGRWLGVTAVLFAVSALLFGVAVLRARRRA
jgi:hypothetical protein